MENWKVLEERKKDAFFEMLGEGALEEMQKKTGLLMEALDEMEEVLRSEGADLTHMFYSEEFSFFYGFPWKMLGEDVELFVAFEEDGYIYRCLVNLPAYEEGEDFVDLFRVKDGELEVWDGENGWILAGDAQDVLEDSGEVEEEECSFSVDDLRDSILDEADFAEDVVAERQDILQELLQDALGLLAGRGEKVARQEVSWEAAHNLTRTELTMVGLEEPVMLYRLQTKDGSKYCVYLCMQEEDEPDDGMFFGYLQENGQGEKHFFPKVYTITVN